MILKKNNNFVFLPGHIAAWQSQNYPPWLGSNTFQLCRDIIQTGI